MYIRETYNTFLRLSQFAIWDLGRSNNLWRCVIKSTSYLLGIYTMEDIVTEYLTFFLQGAAAE